MSSEEIQIHERLTRIETALTNHCQHYDAALNEQGARIKELSDRQWWFIGIVLGGFITVIIKLYA